MNKNMRTSEKTSKQAGTQANKQATAEKDTADLSIDLATYCEAMKLAKAEGMETEDWIEKLIRKNASKPAPNITQNPDGTLTAHGDFAERMEAAAAARGMTLSQYADSALVHLMTKEIEEPSFEDAIYDGKLPVYLDADTVRFLREICEAGTITAEDFTDAIIGDHVEDYKAGKCSDGDFILDLWEIADKPSAAAAMQAVVERWKAKQAAKA